MIPSEKTTRMNGSAGVDSWRNNRHGPADTLYAPRATSVSASPSWQDDPHAHHHHAHSLAVPISVAPHTTASPLVHYAHRQPLTMAPTPQLLSSYSLQGKSAIFTKSTMRFVLLCILWYGSSALSSNTGKQIMNQFRYPVTLTLVQFGFVSGFCLIFTNPAFGWSKLRKPNMVIVRNTLPMAVFQVGGHIFSSMAISRVPVSTVHTIKALSPLFTVAAYALLFGVRYSASTYISLLPLTLGVMLACSFDLNFDNALGLICALGSALVFVSSNIVFKKIMPTEGGASSGPTPSHKLDKLNLLFYSSGLAFILMLPIWVWSDLGRLLDHDHHARPKYTGNSEPAHGVMYYFILNGTVHWAQNIIAFMILSSTSPVTYSIASLVKRIAVILIAIAWFAQPVHFIQGIGILLTFVGLWMYQRAKTDVDRGEKKMARRLTLSAGGLPMTSRDAKLMGQSTPAPSPLPDEGAWERAGMPTYSISSGVAVQQQPQGLTSPVGGANSYNYPSTTGHTHPATSPSSGDPTLTHQRRISAAVHGHSLLPPPPHQQSHRPQPPRLDTYSIHQTVSTSMKVPPPLQPISPNAERDNHTDPYPSPPASLDSPPHHSLSSLPPVGSGGSGGGSLYNRRPIMHVSQPSDTDVGGGLGAEGGPDGAPSFLPMAVAATS
ncbi:suppressor of loss of ypt1 [Tulasnella sp. JGI-2019a]|nr:suppressor of loss of ypt1 [Tulasnella sp. JGI-2019a]KAG9018405.1 suppressor of loss of ypt1 [Tulasnella sp. JGI-2019a]KAG9037541.1 suppressor of loss of ypt1 [Tulasnella sp. JGI-2019a]